jgi:hypothetical protein
MAYLTIQPSSCWVVLPTDTMRGYRTIFNVWYRAPLLEIDTLTLLQSAEALARAIVDPELADSMSNRLYIPGIPKGQTIQSRCDPSTHPFILEADSPFTKVSVCLNSIIQFCCSL